MYIAAYHFCGVTEPMLPRHSMPRRNARRMPRRMPRRKSSMLYVADHGHTLYAPLPPLRKTSTKLYASSTQALRSLDAEMPRVGSASRAPQSVASKRDSERWNSVLRSLSFPLSGSVSSLARRSYEAAVSALSGVSLHVHHHSIPPLILRQSSMMYP